MRAPLGMDARSGAPYPCQHVSGNGRALRGSLPMSTRLWEWTRAPGLLTYVNTSLGMEARSGAPYPCQHFSENGSALRGSLPMSIHLCFAVCCRECQYFQCLSWSSLLLSSAKTTMITLWERGNITK